MTSAAISLLSTAGMLTTQPSAPEKAAKADTASFAATLQKAGQAHAGKTAAAPAPKAETPGGHQPAQANLGTVMVAPATPDETLPVEVPAQPLVTPTLDGSSSHPAEALSGLEGELVQPADQQEPVDSAAVVDTQAPGTPVLTNDLALAAVPVTPPQAPVTPPTADASQERTLGSTLLASITLGKSLEKSSAAQDLPAMDRQPGDDSVDDQAGAGALKAAERVGVQAVATLPAAAEHAAKAALPPVQQAPDDDATTVTGEALRDTKLTDFQARLDSVNNAGQAIATPMTSASQGTQAPTASATVKTPVGSLEWAKQVGQQLVNFHLKGDQNVQLHLNPANLGPMSITLNVDEHLQATAHFAAHSVQVRAALEQGIAQLRDAMAQQGISLGDTSVGEQRQQGFAHADQGQSRQGNIQQLPGMSIVADEPVQEPASSAARAGEISIYA